MDKLRKLTKLRGKEDTQKLIAVLKSLEWSYPTPKEADTDGACPSCYASKPAKLWFVPAVRPTEFERENHMKVCELADALQLEDN